MRGDDDSSDDGKCESRSACVDAAPDGDERDADADSSSPLSPRIGWTQLRPSAGESDSDSDSQDGEVEKVAQRVLVRDEARAPSDRSPAMSRAGTGQSTTSSDTAVRPAARPPPVALISLVPSFPSAARLKAPGEPSPGVDAGLRQARTPSIEELGLHAIDKGGGRYFDPQRSVRCAHASTYIEVREAKIPAGINPHEHESRSPPSGPPPHPGCRHLMPASYSPRGTRARLLRSLRSRLEPTLSWWQMLQLRRGGTSRTRLPRGENGRRPVLSLLPAPPPCNSCLPQHPRHPQYA